MKKGIAALMALMLLLGAAALAEADLSGVADASEMTDVIDVVQPGMTPVTAEALNDGVYEVAVDSSSSMFKVVGCDLTVKDGQMTVLLRMKSDAYLYMYPGAAEDAAKAPLEDLSPLMEPDEGSYAFVLPVDALDAGYTCAAFSARKQAWYPRTLLFRSDSLPADAWKEEGLATAQTLDLADGVYTVEVVLEGGRAALGSPALMTVEGGACTADIVFNTKKIDYVIVDGEKYLPTSTEDGAAFTVPVAGFDRKLTIVVDSTAIKPAAEVTYTMTFDSASIAAKGQ